MGHDLESLEISIIPYLGKSNLDRPAMIFRNLGIHVFLMWGSSKEKEKAVENHLLLLLLNQKKEDWSNMVEKNFACFEQNMDIVLKSEIRMHCLSNARVNVKTNLIWIEAKQEKCHVISKILEKTRKMVKHSDYRKK